MAPCLRRTEHRGHTHLTRPGGLGGQVGEAVQVCEAAQGRAARPQEPPKPSNWHSARLTSYIFNLHFIPQEAFRQRLPEAGQACSPCSEGLEHPSPASFLEHLLFSAPLDSGMLPAQAPRATLPSSLVLHSVTCWSPPGPSQEWECDRAC